MVRPSTPLPVTPQPHHDHYPTIMKVPIPKTTKTTKKGKANASSTLTRSTRSFTFTRSFTSTSEDKLPDKPLLKHAFDMLESSGGEFGCLFQRVHGVLYGSSTANKGV